MCAIIPQADMQMTGETGLNRLQPATQLLQTTEQGNAEGGAARGSDRGDFGTHSLGGLLFHCLLPIFPFIYWWKNVKKNQFSLKKGLAVFLVLCIFETVRTHCKWVAGQSACHSGSELYQSGPVLCSCPDLQTSQSLGWYAGTLRSESPVF